MTDQGANGGADREREWYEHAQAAGFVFLALDQPMAKHNPPGGWAKPGAKVRGKYPAADVALTMRGDGEGRPNLAVGSENGTNTIIVDADDGEAVKRVDAFLERAGVVTLSQTTPRGVGYLFTLPAGVRLEKLDESMVGGLGLLGTRPAGFYQVGPGSVVGAGCYGPKKAPPDDSGGPWAYRPRDVVPAAVMPDSLIEATRTARAMGRGEGPRTEHGPDGYRDRRPSSGAGTRGQALGCRTVGLGIETLRHLVTDQGGGRNDSVYRVACSLIWHGAMTEDNRAEVEARLIEVQGELRAGEKRDVRREVPEQFRHAFAFVADQRGRITGAIAGT